ncbi:MAG: cell surface protein SprA, partial [Bacteroidaceae bacterium]|nr:cell surface protein SprA [Bacteroidaceae bacterium]
LDSILARKQSNVKGVSDKKLPNRKVQGFAKEIALLPDSQLVVKHDQKSNRLRITALDSTGHPVKIRYKRIDETSIRIKNEVEDTTQLRLNIIALPKREEQKWYTWAQAGARLLMSLRNVSLSYRNTYNLALPGFLPQVGDMLGQTRNGGNGPFSPGIDFGFGLVGDSYIERAKERGWLLCADSVSTPATTARTEDMQIKATVEPLTDLKIDLSMSHTHSRNKSIQYMYQGNPTVQSGSFSMTTISLRTAFRGSGNARNGYRNKTFTDFQRNLDIMQQRVEQQYIGTQYPQGVGFQGQFNPANGTVNKYSADVMIPAFLAAYTGSDAKTSALDIFPAMSKMLPNWNVTYKGLSNLPWVRDNFKSVNLTHGYKSVYNVGAYQSYSSWVESMGSGGAMGYALNTTTGTFMPSSMFDISTVSLNESFSPLIGLNMTFMNNMTLKMEYKTTRVSTLSVTSAQINETGSNDMVIGWGYKINDFRLSSIFGSGKASAKAKKRAPNSKRRDGEAKEPEVASTSKSNFAHDLNLRFDFSLRNQSAIRRDLQTSLSEATSGSKAFKTSAAVEYTVSRMVSLSLYYDRQRSEPLLSSSSYPTVTQDFGMSMKFSLTR